MFAGIAGRNLHHLRSAVLRDEHESRPDLRLGSSLAASGMDFWIYLTAPPLGMLAASEIYLWRKGRLAVKCCKLHHNNNKRCIFCGANGGFAS